MMQRPNWFSIEHSTGSRDFRDITVLLIALSTILLYLPVGKFEFVNFDDPSYVFQNPHVLSGLSIEGVKWAFSTLNGGTSYWHPVTWLSHQLDCQLFGLRAGFHHLSNVVIHTVNATLLFSVLHRISKGLYMPSAVACLFAWHPMHVESVAWISERKDVLSTLFAIITVSKYIDFAASPRWDRLLYSLLAYAASLASKPMFVTLPAVLLALDI